MTKDNNYQNNNGNAAGYNLPLVRNVFFKRARGCPLSGENAPVLDYRNLALLRRFLSERGRIMPSRISCISPKKQRKLAREVKRARFLALLPFVVQ